MTVKPAAVKIPTPTSWGLSVSQPSTHTAGIAWAHFGNLTVTGTLTPAPPVGTVVDLLRNGRGYSHTTVGAGGAFKLVIANAPNAGTFTYQAKLPATGATSPGVHLINKAPTVTTKAPSTIDSVKAGAIALAVQPAIATKVTLSVLDGGWKPTAFATSTTAGAASASFVYGEGTMRKYYLHGQFTAPDGTVIVGGAAQTVRVPKLDAVIRATTSADVKYTYRAGCPVGPSQLRTITMNYVGYDNRVHTGGVLIVRKDLTGKFVGAFTDGMAGRFPLKQMSNPNRWLGNDVTMMNADNTSAFNCRHVTGNPNAMSPHSYGYAVDINTWENPYKDVYGRWYGDTRYAYYRPASVTGLLVSSSALTKGLVSRGANWYVGFDWQHFDMK